METWKEFEANELTHSAAHHLAAIDACGRDYGGWARVSDIARYLDITRGSVSINLRTLKKRGLVLTDEHHLVKLSSEGEQIVLDIWAKRSVLRVFFESLLGLESEQAEIDSCKMEHLLSDRAAELLRRFVRERMPTPGPLGSGPAAGAPADGARPSNAPPAGPPPAEREQSHSTSGGQSG